MSIVVGIVPGRDPRPAVRLGALLARSYSRRLVLVSITSSPWGADNRNVDAEYRAFSAERTSAFLAAAAGMVPAGVEVEEVSWEARSPRRGLLGVCRKMGAFRLVLGSSEDAPEARIRLGSVSTGLLHSAQLPVALAPKGFDTDDEDRISRVSAAFNGSENSAELVLGAAIIAGSAHAAFRVVAFSPRQGRSTSLEAGLGSTIEDEVVKQWRSVIRGQTDSLLADIAQLDPCPTSAEVALGTGHDWADAVTGVNWSPTEVLMVGSRTLGPLTRLSVGSRAAKIIRHSPVPVVLVPHRATDGYAAQAETTQPQEQTPA